MLGEEHGDGAAQSHEPHPQTRHHGLGDVPQLLAVPWLDDSHVAVGADQSKQPKSDAGVENGESGHYPAEDISEGPVVQVVVDHPEGKQQDEGEVHHRHVDHVDSDRVPPLGGEREDPQGGDIDDDSDDEDEAVEDQTDQAVLHRPLLRPLGTGLHRHVGGVKIQLHTETYISQQEENGFMIVKDVFIE